MVRGSFFRSASMKIADVDINVLIPTCWHPYCRFWNNQPRPKGVRQGQKRKCFFNAFQLADRNSDYCYVEGWADDNGLLLEHAWCVDRSGNVIDPTWQYNPHIVYFGVPLTMTWAYAAVTKNNGHWSSLWHAPTCFKSSGSVEIAVRHEFLRKGAELTGELV